MQRKAILVVEDDQASAGTITLALNVDLAYQAQGVANGSAALARIAAGGADLVLLGINLPDLDGFAVHDALCLDPGTAALPILFMAAGHHDREFARRGGHTRLAKPFAPEDLVGQGDRLLASACCRPPAVTRRGPVECRSRFPRRAGDSRGRAEHHRSSVPGVLSPRLPR